MEQTVESAGKKASLETAADASIPVNSNEKRVPEQGALWHGGNHEHIK